MKMGTTIVGTNSWGVISWWRYVYLSDIDSVRLSFPILYLQALNTPLAFFFGARLHHRSIFWRIWIIIHSMETSDSNHSLNEGHRLFWREQSYWTKRGCTGNIWSKNCQLSIREKWATISKSQELADCCRRIRRYISAWHGKKRGYFDACRRWKNSVISMVAIFDYFKQLILMHSFFNHLIYFSLRAHFHCYVYRVSGIWKSVKQHLCGEWKTSVDQLSNSFMNFLC